MHQRSSNKNCQTIIESIYSDELTQPIVAQFHSTCVADGPSAVLGDVQRHSQSHSTRTSLSLLLLKNQRGKFRILALLNSPYLKKYIPFPALFQNPSTKISLSSFFFSKYSPNATRQAQLAAVKEKTAGFPGCIRSGFQPRSGPLAAPPTSPSGSSLLSLPCVNPN